MQKEQIQIPSSSVGLQEIDFNWNFFFFFTESPDELDKGDNVGRLHLDFCKACDQILHTVLTQ